MKRKITTLFLSFFLFFAFVIYTYPIWVVNIVEWYVKDLFEKNIKSPIVFGKSYLKNGSFEFNDILIKGENPISIESLYVSCGMDWKLFRPYIFIEAYRPSSHDFHWQEKKQELIESPSFYSPPQSLERLWFDLDFRVIEGRYYLADKDKGMEESSFIDYEIDSFEKEAFLKWHVLDSEDPTSILLHWQGSFNPASDDPFSLHLNINKAKMLDLLHMQWLKEALGIKGWDITNGILDGYFSIFQNSNGQLVGSGSCSLEDAHLKSEKKGFTIELPAARAQINISPTDIPASFYTDPQELLPKLRANIGIDLTCDANGKILAQKDQFAFWQIENVGGKLKIQPFSKSNFSIQGQLAYLDKEVSLDSQGYFFLQSPPNSDGRLDKLHAYIHLLSPNQTPAHVDIHLSKNLAKTTSFLEVDCSELMIKDLEMLLLPSKQKEASLKDIHFNRGSLNLKACCELTKEGVQNVLIESIEAKNVLIRHSPSKINLELDLIKGEQCTLYLEPWDLLGNMTLEQGKAYIDDYQSKHFIIDQFYSKLSFQQGSAIGLLMEGYKGDTTLHFKGRYEDDSLSITSSTVGNFFQLIPDPYRKYIQEQKENDFFKEVSTTLSCTLFKIDENSLKLNGAAVCYDQLQGTEEALLLESILHWNAEKPKEITLEYLQFSGEQISLEKFIQPFIFSSSDYSLLGKANLQGRVENEILKIDYTPTDWKLKASSFSIENTSKSQPCSFTFDFNNGNYWGDIFLNNAKYYDSYLEKQFESINGKIVLSKDVFSFPNLQGVFQNSTFDLDLYIDISEKNSFLQLKSHSIQGDIIDALAFIPSLQHEAHTFSDTLHGFFKIEEEGLQGIIPLGKIENEKDSQLQITGLFYDLEWASLEGIFSFKKGQGNFSYDLKEDRLDCSEIMGQLPSNTHSDSTRIIHLSIPNIICNQFSTKPHGDVNLFLFSNENKISEATFEFHTAIENSEKKYIIQQKSSEFHLGAIIFNYNYFTLDKNLSIYELQSKFEFDLAKVAADMSMLWPAILLDLEKTNTIQNFIVKSCNGKFSADINLVNRKDSVFALKCTSEKCDFLSYKDAKSFFDLEVTSKHIVIKKGTINDISFSGDVDISSPKQLHLRHGWIDIPKHFSGYFDACYTPENHNCAVSIKSIDILLPNPLLSSYIDENYLSDLTGLININGNISFHYTSPEKYEYQYQISLRIESLSNQNYQIISPIPFEIQGNSKSSFISLRNGSVIFSKKFEEQFRELFLIEPQEVQYIFEKQQLKVALAHIEFQQENIDAVLSLLSIDSKQKSVFNLLKGPIQGLITGELSPYSYDARISLLGGNHSGAQQGEISQCDIEYSSIYGGNVKMYLHWLNSERALFELSSKDPSFSYGEFSVSDANNRIPSSIKTTWDRNEHGFTIQKIQGNVYGMYVNLSNKQPLHKEFSHLQGLIGFRQENGSKGLQNWLKQQGFDLGICKAKAQIDIPKIEIENTTCNLEFEGQHINAKGVEIDKMRFKALLHPQWVHVEDFQGSKDRFFMKMARGRVYKKEGLWFFDMPLFQLYDFKCGSLQKDSKSRLKHLILHYVELKNFYGSLQKTNTIEGSGHINFTNIQKRGLFDIVFSLPGEVMSQFGIAPSLLTPVRGSISFAVGEQKLVLSQDSYMYSFGRKSKFYLIERTNPSYIDFDGNIDISLGLRQQIMFRIGHLFSVQVQGTIYNPAFKLKSLNNPQKKRLRRVSKT